MLAVETTGCIPFILRSNLHFICNPLVCTRQHTRTRRVDLRNVHPNVHPNAILGELEGVVNSFWLLSLASQMGQREGRQHLQRWPDATLRSLL